VTAWGLGWVWPRGAVSGGPTPRPQGTARAEERIAGSANVGSRASQNCRAAVRSRRLVSRTTVVVGPGQGEWVRHEGLGRRPDRDGDAVLATTGVVIARTFLHLYGITECSFLPISGS